MTGPDGSRRGRTGVGSLNRDSFGSAAGRTMSCVSWVEGVSMDGVLEWIRL